MNADLVLEGGGMKGFGLVGALAVLEEEGFTFQRVAGTSAGAIVAAFLAADMPATKIEEIMREADYLGFLDDRLLGELPFVGKPVAMALRNGIYKGDRLRRWLAEHLAEAGVETFGDLRLGRDPDSSLGRGHKYRLVVMATDVSHGRLVRLPWDYRTQYGMDPDRQSVAEAVRASIAIPFFFEPVRFHSPKAGRVMLVDGGVVSNFPIDVFDRVDNGAPRWPTFGVRLCARPDTELEHVAMLGPLGFAAALIATMVNAHDQMSLDDPHVAARAILVDTTGANPIDFAMSEREREALYDHGREAALRFLKDWNFAAYVEAFRRSD